MRHRDTQQLENCVYLTATRLRSNRPYLARQGKQSAREQPTSSRPKKIKECCCQHSLKLKLFWWPGTESNRRHADFQSAALPTELPGRIVHCIRHEFSSVNKEIGDVKWCGKPKNRLAKISENAIDKTSETPIIALWLFAYGSCTTFRIPFDTCPCRFERRRFPQGTQPSSRHSHFKYSRNFKR